MQIDVDTCVGFRGLEMPRGFHLRGRYVEVVEVVDQWHGPGYRYVKVEGADDGLYILRFDHLRAQWTLTLFKSPRAQAMQRSGLRHDWSARVRPKRLS